MDKKAKLLVAIAGLFIFLACNAFAGLTTTLYYQNDGQPSGYRDPNSVGGEFTAVFSGNTTLSTYILDNYSSKAKATVTTGYSRNKTEYSGIETFCVEMTETMTPGTAYSASFGGNTISPGAAGARNYLTMGTAYLYSQFAQGMLKGYNYNTSGSLAGIGTREFTADELQDAIWYLQGEMTTGRNGNQNDWNNRNLAYSFNLSDPTSDPFVQLAEQACGGTLAGAECTNTLACVQVLELTCGTQPAQDQLIYCPVPEPGTFAAGAIFLLPLGWSMFRRLRRKEARARAGAGLVPVLAACENRSLFSCPAAKPRRFLFRVE